MITRREKIDITLTPKELANEFWELDADQQATFFEELAIISDIDLVMQLQYLKRI